MTISLLSLDHRFSVSSSGRNNLKIIGNSGTQKKEQI